MEVFNEPEDIHRRLLFNRFFGCGEEDLLLGRLGFGRGIDEIHFGRLRARRRRRTGRFRRNHVLCLTDPGHFLRHVSFEPVTHDPLISELHPVPSSA